MFNHKSGPRKKVSKVKIYDDTVGDHRLSPDGSECYIGGSKFKRTVLKSVAAPRVEVQKLNSELEEIDEASIKETDGID